MRAVLFDLDGIITDTAKYHFVAWKKLGKSLGIEIDEKFNEQLKGVSRKDSLETILRKGEQSADYSRKEKIALCEKKNEYYLKLIQKMTPDDILPGILSLLKDLKSKNIKTVITSASKNAPIILDKLHIRNLFNDIVDPSIIPRGKPAPDIFLTGAQLINVDPADCVGIEDAISGVEAISSAGITAVAVGEEEKLALADKVLPKTTDLSYKILEETWRERKTNSIKRSNLS